LLVVAGLALYFLPRLKKAPTPHVTDFASCQKWGGSIVDGEPVKCYYNGQTYEEADHNEPDVVLDKPLYGDLVTSPMVVKGKARGTWFFEASMPVVLKDDSGKVLYQGSIPALGDWMTTDYVEFATSIPFDPGSAQNGVLIISKDNPSGDPQFDSAHAVPVRFK